MIIPKTVQDVLQDHTTLKVEGIDRVYLNLYIPNLQFEQGAVGFFRKHRGAKIASSALMEPMSRSFAQSIDKFIAEWQLPIVRFTKNQRKDDVAKEHLANFSGVEGVLFVGKAQEKAYCYRTEKRRNPTTGMTYPWIVKSTVMVNYFYFYCVDEDFGPFFLKFCSYFPYNGKLCINGHEYLKRQLTKEGIEYTPLDNGVAACEDPQRLQEICAELDERRIEWLFAKWLKILPNPFTDEDRAAGYHYQLSLQQIEFSLTLMLDRPISGRVFFEQIIRENLDIGRPDHVQLIFQKRINKRTPGRFRTRVITEGVIPSLHLDYKKTRIKMYFKEGRALRIETTINDTRDFRVGKRLTNLPELRKIGFHANRRVLEVAQISQDLALGEQVLTMMHQPIVVNGVRTSALPFANHGAQCLLQTLPLFRLQPNGFDSKEIRTALAKLTGKEPDKISPGTLTYNLRRLRLRGLIERIPKSHRYRVTDLGLRVALFYTKAYNRILRPGLAEIVHPGQQAASRLAIAFNSLQKAMDSHCMALNVPAY